MDLSEIEAKADKLLQRMNDTSSATLAGDTVTRLQGLAHAAQIKATVAFRKEREAEWAGQQAAYQLGVPFVPQVVPRSECTPEPTKNVADRLHELVSYLQQQAEECRDEAERKRDVVGQEARKQPGDYMAPAYSEAATKLQEILSEGGI